MIQGYKKEDLQAIIDIWYEASINAHDFIDNRYWASKIDDMRNIYIPMSETYVYKDSSGIKGFVSLNENSLEALFVSPLCQNTGVGKELINKAKELRDSLTLSVYKENQRAERFYKKMGFCKVKEQIDENTGHVEIVMHWERNIC